MRYSVEYTTQAVKALKKLDSQTRRLILALDEKRTSLAVKIPGFTVKVLTPNHSGEWRYRVGDYRIIADISEARMALSLY